MENKLVMVAEVAKYLRVHRSVIQRWCYEGRLKFTRQGRRGDKMFDLNNLFTDEKNDNFT